MTEAKTKTLWDCARPAQGGYREAGPDLVRDAGSVRVIDVREKDEFTGPLGHLSGAELVPLSRVADESSSWNRSELLVLVCRSGRRSGRAAELLVQSGFERVINLEGGMIACKDKGLAIE